MAMELSSDAAVCFRCGTKYGKRRGIFPVSYAATHKGVGFLPVCKQCAEEMYNIYLSQCGDAKLAMRQMCRKFDLYWNATVYDEAINRSGTRSLLTMYMQRLTANRFAGKSYDDTLLEEDVMWSFTTAQPEVEEKQDEPDVETEEKEIEIPDEVKSFWGSGYSTDMYLELEQRREYWMSSLPTGTPITVGLEALIRQICNLEIVIAKDSAAGRPIEKSVNSLNTLLGSLNIKPTQIKDDVDSATERTPFGVWIRRWETQRPIPEPDPELQDVDGIIKYLLVWVYGHLAKMLDIKNVNSELYEKEIERLRVTRPEYNEEDDESMLNDIFGSSSDDGD